MARRYARDNRGRFASSGTGATARGGRLKTASANKRATQTMRAAGAGGVIKGRAARTVAGEKVMAKMAKRAPGASTPRLKRTGETMKSEKRISPDGAIRATDVVKARTHNSMSKMVEKNQDRYVKAALEMGRAPRYENKTRRIIAAQDRISQQKRTVRPEPPTVTGRRGQGGATSRIKRAKVTQPTLMGGKSTTYGPAKFAPRPAGRRR